MQAVKTIYLTCHSIAYWSLYVIPADPRDWQINNISSWYDDTMSESRICVFVKSSFDKVVFGIIPSIDNFPVSHKQRGWTTFLANLGTNTTESNVETSKCV